MEAERHILKKRAGETLMRAWNSLGEDYLETLIKSMKYVSIKVLESKERAINYEKYCFIEFKSYYLII